MDHVVDDIQDQVLSANSVILSYKEELCSVIVLTSGVDMYVLE